MKTFVCLWPDGTVSVTVDVDVYHAALEFDCEACLTGAKIFQIQNGGYFAQDKNHESFGCVRRRAWEQNSKPPSG